MLPPFHVPGLRGLAAHLHHNRTEARILIMTSEERREARYHRRKAARENRRRRRSEALGGADQVYSFRKMFKWGKKCCNNVRWKQSTQNFERHRRLIYDPRIRAVADTVVASVPGGVGMPLGVEPSQMEMVSLPSSVDNWIACQLRAKNPAHYMDDYHMGAETKEQAEKFLQATAQRMEDMGLTVNRNKSKIVPLTKPFRFCKAKFHLTETGRIITHGCRDGMKRARRKLRFFQGEVAAGRKTVEEVARWLNDGPIAYYEQFNDHGRVLKLRRVFYAMFIKDRNTEEVKPCIGS